MAHRDRRAKRQPRRVQLEFRKPGEAVWRRAFTTNLSDRGAFVATNVPSPPGQEVTVRLPPGTGSEFQAKVIHSRRGILGMPGPLQSGMGLRFLTAPPTAESPAVDQARPTPGPAAAVPGPKTESTTPEPGTTGSAPREPTAGTLSGTEITEMKERYRNKLALSERLTAELASRSEADAREAEMLRGLVAKLEENRDRLQAAALAEQRRATALEERLETTRVDLRRRLQASERRRADLERQLDEIQSATEAERPIQPGDESGGLAPPPPGPTSSRHGGRRLMGLGVAAGVLVGLLLGLTLRPGGPAHELAADRRPDEPTVVPEGPAAALADAPTLILEAPVEGGTEPFVDLAALPDETTPDRLPDPREADSVVEAWAAAWAGQRIDDYLSYYSSSFAPSEGATRSQWESERRRRLSRPPWIEIRLGPIERTTTASDRVVATFEQTYETPTYRDRVTKVLDLVAEDGVWKIERERAE